MVRLLDLCAILALLVPHTAATACVGGSCAQEQDDIVSLVQVKNIVKTRKVKEPVDAALAESPSFVNDVSGFRLNQQGVAEAKDPVDALPVLDEERRLEDGDHFRDGATEFEADVIDDAEAGHVEDDAYQAKAAHEVDADAVAHEVIDDTDAGKYGVTEFEAGVMDDAEADHVEDDAYQAKAAHEVDADAVAHEVIDDTDAGTYGRTEFEADVIDDAEADHVEDDAYQAKAAHEVDADAVAHEVIDDTDAGLT